MNTGNNTVEAMMDVDKEQLINFIQATAHWKKKGEHR